MLKSYRHSFMFLNFKIFSDKLLKPMFANDVIPIIIANIVVNIAIGGNIDNTHNDRATRTPSLSVARINNAIPVIKHVAMHANIM